MSYAIIYYTMLKLSAQGDYGLILLKDLATLSDGYHTIKNLAESRGLPIKYLERIAVALTRAGILDSREGQGGGYKLAKSPTELKLTEVMLVLESLEEPVRCMHDGSCCDRAKACPHKTGWDKIHNKLYKLLCDSSLADIFDSIDRKRTNS